jgi:hypothetical protein
MIERLLLDDSPGCKSWVVVLIEKIKGTGLPKQAYDFCK